MREPEFNVLTSRLLKSGITPRHVQRTVKELRDHYDDLVDAAIDSGKNKERARCQAANDLGTLDDFVSQMAARRELKTWAFRYPRVAVLVYPLACIAVIPAIPLFRGAAHAATLVRWGASFIAAGFVTAMLLLTMQLSIFLG